MFTSFILLNCLCLASPSETEATCRCEMWRQQIMCTDWPHTVKQPSVHSTQSESSPAATNTPPILTPTHVPRFRHLLVIIKHNNGFYKSHFASLVVWIIQPQSGREGRWDRAAALVRWASHLRWQATDEAFCLNYLFDFAQLFHNCHIVFFYPLCFNPPSSFTPVFPSTPIAHTRAHTQTVRFISSGVNYGCTSC